MEEKNELTAERSLEIIRNSIEQSQRTIAKNACWPLIWWGLNTVFFALLIAYLWKHHGGPIWNMLWMVMYIVGYLVEQIIARHREPIPTTFVSKTIGQVWGTFGIFCGLIGWILGFVGLGWLPKELLMPVPNYIINITSIISLCFGMGCTITGFIMKSRTTQICGIIAGIGGFFSALYFMGCEQLYVMACVAVIGLIIPGLILTMQNRKNA